MPTIRKQENKYDKKLNYKKAIEYLEMAIKKGE